VASPEEVVHLRECPVPYLLIDTHNGTVKKTLRHRLVHSNITRLVLQYILPRRTSDKVTDCRAYILLSSCPPPAFARHLVSLWLDQGTLTRLVHLCLLINA
jgi:hypothetical protein